MPHSDCKNYVIMVKGHEPRPCEAPWLCWSFLKIYFEKLKGLNKKLTIKTNYFYHNFCQCCPTAVHLFMYLVFQITLAIVVHWTQHLVNRGPDLTFVDEANSSRSSSKPSRVIKLLPIHTPVIAESASFWQKVIVSYLSIWIDSKLVWMDSL